MHSTPGGVAGGLLSSQLNLLVVDDDKDVCEYLEDFLTHDGYHVTTINDPTQVVDDAARRASTTSASSTS